MAKNKGPTVKNFVEMSIGMTIGGAKPAKLLTAMHGNKVQRKNVMPW
jgi:hypothetical protein